MRFFFQYFYTLKQTSIIGVHLKDMNESRKTENEFCNFKFYFLFSKNTLQKPFSHNYLQNSDI